MLSFPQTVNDVSSSCDSLVSTECDDASPVKLTLHLIGNAHLDPVWLWDWREGMNEGIATCRAMVRLLQEFPEFRFIRGEAAVYSYVEEHAPDLFADIAGLVQEGRWDIVGGNWIQPDTNLPSTETMLRQFIRGKDYFRKTFGVEVTTAWAADSFGHSAGLPEILKAAGMENFAFTRPQAAIFPLRSQAFWWRARSGARILAYRPHDGWYASERGGINERLDACLARAEEEGAETAALFYGLGNHGGGPSRRHLQEIREWISQHPEVEVKHSGLHDFFAELRREIERRGDDLIPTVDGELNFCLRGCSASVARFKYAYRRTEAQLMRAERAVVFGGVPSSDQADCLKDAWDVVLFNAFHDILPGSSIERAYPDQLAQLGFAATKAQNEETAALVRLAGHIDTTSGAWTVPADHSQPQPVIVWNPHPWAMSSQVEVEVSLDHRPLWPYEGRSEEIPLVVVDAAQGKALPLQVIPEEHDSFRHIPWRRRVVVPVEVPPLGWTLLQMGIDPCASVTRPEPLSGTPRFRCEAAVGNEAVHFTRDGAPWLPGGVQIRLYEDTWGAWGGMNEEPESWLLTKEIERLSIVETAEVETGPLRFATWVRFAGTKSRSTIELTFQIDRDSDAIHLSARCLLADRGVRMKLVIPAPGADGWAEYAVPGGEVDRAACGEVSGNRWVRAGGGDHRIGFASDALYGFDTTKDELRATIARTSRYASDVNYAPHERPWQPCADLGEHVFRALLTPDVASLPQMSEELQTPLVSLTVPASVPSAGARFRARDSAFHIDQLSVRLVGVTQKDETTIVVRLQNQSDARVACITGRCFGAGFELTGMLPYEIAAWELTREKGAPDFIKSSKQNTLQ